MGTHPASLLRPFGSECVKLTINASREGTLFFPLHFSSNATFTAHISFQQGFKLGID